MRDLDKKMINIIVVLLFLTSIFVHANLFFLITHDDESISIVDDKKSHDNNEKSKEDDRLGDILYPYNELEIKAIDLLKNMTYGLINDNQTEFEKAIILMNFTHFYLNTTASYVDGHKSSIYLTVLRGNGMCPDFAGIFVSLCRIYNIGARRIAIFGDESIPPYCHTIAEAYIDGNLKIFDAMFNMFLDHSILEFHNLNILQRRSILSSIYNSLQLRHNVSFVDREGIITYYTQALYISMAEWYGAFFRFFENPSIFDSYRMRYSSIYNDGEVSNFPINLDFSWY